MNGNHIPIKDGEDKQDAVDNFFARKGESSIKFSGGYKNKSKEDKGIAAGRVHQSLDALPTHLKDKISDKNMIITDKPTGGKEKWGGGYNMYTGEITFKPSADQDYNNGVITHEVAHKDFQELSLSKQREWNNANIISQPTTKYTKEVLDKYGDRLIQLGAFKTNAFRDEQYAEINRVLYSTPTKYLAPVIVDEKTLGEQTSFFKNLRGVK